MTSSTATMPPPPTSREQARWAACVAPQLDELATELCERWGGDARMLDVANLLRQAEFRLMDRVAPRQEPRSDH